MTKHVLNQPLTGLFGLSILAVTLSSIAIGGEPPSKSKTTSPPLAPAVAGRIMAVTDVVLEHHIDPPVRQQMILGGIKGLYRAAGLPDPAGLSARVSSLTTREQLSALLTEVWPNSPAKPVSTEALEDALFDGLLTSVPGGAELMSAKDRKVAEQIKGNRYVGVHIALGMDEKDKRPTVHQLFDGGPADRAGMKQGDLIEQIDDFDTKDKPLQEVVDHIRGEEGSFVTLRVRQPQAANSRTYKVKRGTLPRSTVEGIRKASSEGWDFGIDGPNSIAYLRFGPFAASTAHELRKLAGQLERLGFRALVLDLRGLRGDPVHPVVLLADSLLEGGTIGRVRTAHGEKKFEADSDALFRGWPIAVLVDSNTRGTAEWLAAALQDNHRAVIIGTHTSSYHTAVGFGGTRGTPAFPDTGERSTIAIGDGSWSIELLTGRLERGDGRLLSGEMLSGPEEPRRFRLHSAKADEIKFGVIPDHVIGGAAALSAAAMNSRLLSNKVAAVQVPKTENDEFLRKAIDVLRESLKKKA